MFARGIVRESKGYHYDCLIWVGGYFAAYLEKVTENISSDVTIIDFIDSPSLWEEREKIRSGSNSILRKYNLWKIKKWEGNIIKRTDATIYVSDVDAAAVPSGMGPTSTRHVIPNGMLAETYTASTRPDIPSPNIGFLGNMSYPPNIEAVHWLYEKVFLPLKEEWSNLSLIIIGRNPVESIKNLGDQPGVKITGTVDDIWPFVNSIDLFVFPLLIGAGMKNKILEVMYAGKPVLTTQIGNEGINAVPGRDLVVCSSKEEFRKEAHRLLNHADERTRIGNSAHEFIAEKFTWERILKNYEELIGGETIAGAGR